ncbi:Mov34/MPN/PAD-1 family protein [Terripilifer ovatus]|uniref:Mov34/MPN/PAD-1 family protein n=1 Tax=Terripilifer ovatus TaxID=3032367 RepID=UPI003AB96505
MDSDRVHSLSESCCCMMVYPIGGSGQRLVFATSVIAHLQYHRQRRWWHREAGGQLFARFSLPDILIEEATGPRRSDRRTQTSYEPNRRAEQREIFSRHQRGLHFIGDWHTHAESIPKPSMRDADSMSELVAKSEHALNGFVLVIVGTDPLPDGLYVALSDRKQSVALQPELFTKTGSKSAERLPAQAAELPSSQHSGSRSRGTRRFI